MPVMPLNEKTIRMAAGIYPNTCGYILEGKADIEPYYINERKAAIQSLRNEAEQARQDESAAIMASAPNAFKKQSDVLRDVSHRIREIYDDIDFKTIEKTFKHLMLSKDDFHDLSRQQQTKLVLTTITEDRNKKRNKKEKTQSIFEKEASLLSERMITSEDGNVSQFLQTTVS